MWMDVAQETDHHQVENRSDDEDTVYDRNSDSVIIGHSSLESRGMLDETDTRCGIANWRPDILQEFATKNIFTGVFILAGICQGATWAYYTTTISTIEKRFKMSSETTGSLLAGNELAQVIISILFSYFAIRNKRMKYITAGASLWAFSCFLLASHQMFFGSGKYALSLTKLSDSDLSSDKMVDVELHPGIDPGLSEVDNATEFANLMGYSYANDRVISSTQLCLRDVEFISNSTQTECKTGDSGSSFPMSFIFVSQMISGAGTILFLSSGGPYMEDIVMPNQLPLVFGITLSLRLIGPFFGYILGSAFLKSFISTTSIPTIGQEDPRWMGAWWLGWLVLGIVMTVFAAILSLFPRQMAKEVLKKRSVTTDCGSTVLTLPSSALFLSSAELKVANVLPVARNLLKTLTVFYNNQINLFITLSTIFHMLMGIGYWTFLPKYLELIFHWTPSGAAMLSGGVSVAFQAGGFLVSGLMISKFLPNSERVSLWNVLVTSIQILVLLMLTQFGCDHDITFGHSLSSTHPPTTATQPLTTTTSIVIDQFNQTSTMLPLIDITSTIKSRTVVHLLSNCSVDCDCHMGPIMPLCDEKTGHVFYSPCHAGCESVLDNGTVFAQCSCIEENSTLTKGFCEAHGQCFAGFVTFLVLTAISQFLGSTIIVGKMLIFYRSVAPEGRSLVIGLSVLFISIFAILPSPIIFGSLIDSGCQIWENTCAGWIGNCWLYDNKTLRYAFNLTAAGLLLLGGCFDVLLWRKVKVKDVRLYDGDIDHIPKPSSSGNQYEDDKPRTRISSSAYS